MQNNFKTKLDVLLNQLFVEKEEDKKLSIALSVVNEIISFMGLETKQIEDEILFSRLPLPNSERFDTWFKDHPRHRGYTACFNLFKNDLLEIQFYNQKKKSKLFIAGAVNFFPNFEDRESFISDRVGIDIFLTPNNKSILIVLSNKYKLRVLELHRKLSNTQVEIFKKWENISTLNDKKQLHTTLWDSLQLKEVNKNFYIGLSNIFLDLTQDIKSEIKDNFLEKDILENTANQFGIKFLTRLIFIWFLKVKGFVSEENEYFDISKIGDDNLYYKNHLSKLFFEVLNVEIKDRNIKDTFTPYLNGGLFDRNNDGYWADKNPTFPKGFFKVLFDHLNEYNFTTDESTPEYEQIAIDPEMLGKIFENLLASLKSDTGAQARKAKGSFYTPREIVSYMVKESLREYLFTSTNADDSEKDYINNLLDKNDNEWAIALSNNKNIVNKKDVISKIINSLDNLKLLDPACGSGAYPIGVLQKMLSIYERLDSRFDILKVKTEIIKNNIYGVDIDPIAIDICRLRVFLSLTIEQNMNFKKDNNGISTLPNLDFKFVCANTLIQLSNNIQTGLFDDPELKEKLLNKRNEYFSATKNNKSKIQKEYLVLIDYKNKNQSSFNQADRDKQLKSYNPFDINNSCSFYDPSLMHGVEGFDIVIGNPPYVQVPKGIYSKNNFPYSEGKDKGKQNLYKLFTELAFNLLKENGVSTYILQSSLMCDISSQYTRELLLSKTEIKIFIEFPKKSSDKDGQVFDSVLQGTCVFLFKKTIPKPDYYFKISIDNNVKTLENLVFENVLQNKIFDLYPNGFYIPLVRQGELEIINKVRQNTDIFNDSIEIIKQGDLNLTSERDYFSEDKTEIKLYRGRNTHKYYLDNNIEEFVVKNYKVEIIQENYNHTFLICQQITGTTDEYRLHFSKTENEQYLFGNSVNKIKLKVGTLNNLFLGLMNSNFMDWFFRKTSTNNHVNGYEIEQLPIPLITPSNQQIVNKIESLVQNILDQKSKDKDTNTKDLEKEIDTLVYELYGLTEEEREVIENNR